MAAGAERASAEEAEAAAGHRVKKQKARKQGLPAYPPAPKPAPAPAAPTLTPKLTPTLAPASAAVGKDPLLDHFVWNDAGRSVAQPLTVQRHYVESIQTTVIGMSATLLPASDHIIHTQFSNAPVAIYKQTIAKKKPESKFKWALPVHL